MKGYRFYEELENKNRKSEESKGTVIALPINDDGGRGAGQPIYIRTVETEWGQSWTMAAISGVYDEPNSPACGSSVSRLYLQKRARRVSESRARSIHPKLFEYLDEK